MSDILKDSRFAKYLNDPRYKQIPKHEKKVKIDERFKSMFKDEKFKVKYTVDKRGRPVKETSTENLRKYYDIDNSENSEHEESEIDENQGRFVKRLPSEDKEDIGNHQHSVNDKLVRGKLDTKTKNRLLDLDIDYARGEGVLLTDSSSDEASSEEDQDSELEHEWGELDADAETTEDSTRRIAICNMDWDNIKATDIMVLLSSFLPPGGIIHKISIYPSEYGIKRLKEEEINGPLELTYKTIDELSDDGGNEEGSTYHMEKLRRYQLNRLKYYYAVVECDSVATADKLYSECDGIEYESSATRLDMRFIPDDVTFDQEAREECTNLPDLGKYKPRLFTTTALQQAKVQLTWDTTNPNRTEAIKSALDGKIDDLDLKEYLASSSEEDENIFNEKRASQEDPENNDLIQKYKMLLQNIEKKGEKKKNKDMEMEITWGLGIKNKAEELVQKKLKEDNKSVTPFEQYLQKRKEKKKQRKLQNQHKQENGTNTDESDNIPSDIDLNDSYFTEEFDKAEFKKKNSKMNETHKTEPDIDEENEKRKAELELLLDEDDDGKQHFSLKKIQESENDTKKSKRKRKLKAKLKEQKKALPEFEINLNDQRFNALYNSHLFNIDPSDPNYKKTKNMEKLIQEKLKRRPADTPGESLNQVKKSREDVELNVLVKSLKHKTKYVIKNNK